MRKAGFLIAFVVIVVMGFFLVKAPKLDRQPQYVGSPKCAECHDEQHDQWIESHHAKAQFPATEQTVLADFSGQKIEHFGIQTEFIKRDGQFIVKTDGPDGELTEFVVEKVIGVTPLQQYLVYTYPNSDKKTEGQATGQLQTLPYAWDVEKKEWYHMYPDEKLSADDPLHWTNWAQNWNHMCADCHTTDLVKNAQDQKNEYHTTFKEETVGCEACHGPGSNHVKQAGSLSYIFAKDDYGLKKLFKTSPVQAMEVCAKCHSFRNQLQPGFHAGKKFSDHYFMNTIDGRSYYHDGQIKEEVYVYGSFLQSKMMRNNVTCMDCHQVHSGEMKFKKNQLCYQCHDQNTYGSTSHHFHKLGSQGAQCVECHMPERTYMGIDRRRDHSLRVPRPDLSVKIGVPNACVGCHLDSDRKGQAPEYANLLTASEKGDQAAKDRLQALNMWANGVMKKQKKPTDQNHYGLVFSRASRGEPEARSDLEKIVMDRKNYSPMVRASALSYLGQYGGEAITRTLASAAYDKEDALIRRIAASMLRGPDHLSTLRDRLKDEALSVRISALQSLLEYPDQIMRQELSKPYGKKVLAEYRAVCEYNKDQAGSHLNMAVLQEKLMQAEEAVASYRKAIELQPEIAGARSNLSNLLDRLGKKNEARELRMEEIKLFERDLKLDPGNHGLWHRYGLMLYLQGEPEKALEALQKLVKLAPSVPQYQLTLVLLYRKLKHSSEAMQALEKLMKLQPHNQSLQQLKKEIEKEL